MTLNWFGQQLGVEAVDTLPRCEASLEPSLLRLTWADGAPTGTRMGPTYDQGVGLRFSPVTRQLVALELPVGGDLYVASPEAAALQPAPAVGQLRLLTSGLVTTAGWNRATLTPDGEHLFVGPLPPPGARPLRIGEQATLWRQGGQITAIQLQRPYLWLAPGTGTPQVVREALVATWRIWSVATAAERRDEEPPDGLLAQAAKLRTALNAQRGTEQLSAWLESL